MSEKNGNFEQQQKHTKLNKYERAFFNAKDRLSKNPHEYLANLEMGKIFLTARKVEEAIIFLQKAHSSDPESDEAQQLLFKSYLISEQDDEALLLTKKKGTNSSWHKKAAFQLDLRNQLDNTDKDTKLVTKLKSRINLTTTNDEISKLRIDIYDYILKKYSSAILVFELGNKMLDLNEIRLALEDFENAITISPNSPKLAVNISKSLFLHKQYRTAKYYAHQARVMNPKDVETLSILGACEYELNNKNIALKFLELSNKLKPHSLFTIINLEKLLDPVTDFEKLQNIYTKGKGKSLEIDAALDNKLVVLLVKNNEYKPAKGILQSILEYDPKNTDVLNNLGNVENLLGNYKEAILFFKAAVKHDHKNKQIPLTGIANSYRKLDEPKLTEKFYREALELSSHDPATNMSLGSFLSEQSQFNTAIRYLEAALEFSDTDSLKSDAYTQLGLHYYRLGQLEKSAGFYEKSLKHNNFSYETLINYGVLLTDLGKFNEAIIEFNKALELKPGSTEAYINLGVALKSGGRTRQSIETLSEAISTDPKSPIAHSNYASYQRELGNFELAEKHTKISYSLDPSLPHVKNNYANLLKDSGDMTTAIKYYKDAIKSKETYFEARRNLLSLADKNEAKIQINAILKSPSRKFLSEDERVHKAFALASAYEKIGDQQSFLKHLHEGNALRKKQLGYDFYKDNKLFDVLEKITSNPALNKLEIEQKIDYFQLKATPIFIVGMPRSGTTLVEQILSSHPDITGLGELPHLTNAVFESNLIKGDFIKTKNITELFNSYSQNLKSYNITTKYFTDKMPLNFRWIPFIHLAFPNAKIVNVHRESMAVCWSIYKHYFSGNGNGYAYNLDDIADFYNRYENYLKLVTEKLPKLNFLNFSYDDLTRSQEKETRKLLNHLDLPFAQKCIEFHTNDRSVRTASNSQVRKKMYKNSSAQWINYSSELANLKSKLNN